MGTALPDAYRAFVEYFRPGRFSEELQYYTPGITAGPYELVYLMQRYHALWRDSPHSHSDFVRDLPPYPEPGGILRFAQIGDDSIAFWRTGAQDPNAWDIVINDGSREGTVEFAGDFLDLVAAMLDNAPEVDRVLYYPELMAVFEAWGDAEAE